MYTVTRLGVIDATCGGAWRSAAGMAAMIYGARCRGLSQSRRAPKLMEILAEPRITSTRELGWGRVFNEGRSKQIDGKQRGGRITEQGNRTTWQDRQKNNIHTCQWKEQFGKIHRKLFHNAGAHEIRRRLQITSTARDHQHCPRSPAREEIHSGNRQGPVITGPCCSTVRRGCGPFTGCSTAEPAILHAEQM